MDSHSSSDGYATRLMVDRPRFPYGISDWPILRPIVTLQELRGRTGAHCPSVVYELALFKLSLIWLSRTA